MIKLIKKYLQSVFSPAEKTYSDLNKRTSWHGEQSWITLNRRTRRSKFKKRSRQYGV